MTKKFTITIEGDDIEKRIFHADSWTLTRGGRHVYVDGKSKPLAYLPDAGISIHLDEVTDDTAMVVHPPVAAEIGALNIFAEDYLEKLRVLVQSARVT
jgi:hypothetical protein